jgi:uncharacterized protein (TIGR00255 family)
MTGYGRGEATHGHAKFSVDVHSVNRKQSDVVVNLPRELGLLEPRVREFVHTKISRGRTNVIVTCQHGVNGSRNLALDTALAHTYHEAMRALQQELSVPGEITIGTILQAPGVMRMAEENREVNVDESWPVVQRALEAALGELIKMREREGRHLAKDLVHRLKLIRQSIRQVRVLYPGVVKRYRETLRERINKAGLNLAADDERLLKEISLFADRADISEELTRLESHFSQFAHHLRKNEPVGRTLEFITQEVFRELNTLGAKSNDAAISQHVVACKAELEKIREQIQNLE